MAAQDGIRWFRAVDLGSWTHQAIMPVDIAGHGLVLIRENGRFYAFERSCPHEGADLAGGHCQSGRLHCPRHLASFDLEDGSVSPGWSFRKLRTYPVREEAQVLYVGIAGSSAASAK